MPDKRIYVTRRIPRPGLDKLQEGFEIDFWDDDEVIRHDVLLEKLRGNRYDALLCMLTDHIGQDVLEAAGPQLKIVSTMSVGYEHISIEDCAARNIMVANTPGVSTDSVAELTVTLLLMTARRSLEGAIAVKNGSWGEWKPMWLCGTELTGRILGVYGLGKIGFGVARRLKPFGFTKIYYCDVQETHHMFNRDIFRRMKNSAILINSGRGGVIDHDALVEALRNGEITAAGLDVTEPEPLPKDHPLVHMDNCVILPHMGSNTWDSRNAMAVIAASNCIAAINNQQPVGLVK